MSSEGWLALTVVSAIIGNYFIRRFLKATDYPVEAPGMETAGDDPARIDGEARAILEAHGRKGGHYSIPKAYLPLHASIRSLIEDYQEVSFDPFTKDYDRSLAKCPFGENQDYLQIGTWSDGSPILVRIRSDDEKIYIADVDYCAPGECIPFTPSISHYLVLAKRDYDDSKKVLGY